MSWLDLDTVRPFLDAHHLDLGEEVERFAREHIAPRPHPEDDASARTEARELLMLMGRQGLFRHAVPEEHGGAGECTGGPDLRACCLIREVLGAASPLADNTFALQALGSMPLTLAGSAEQRRHWLPRVARGEAMAAFAMTEPEAGSDVGALSTTARRAGTAGDGPGGDWLLDGHKAFITNAGLADFYCTFARTDPEKTGSRGISCFLVPANTEGLSLLRAQVLSAPHPLGELGFEGCRLPPEALVGEEGRGFAVGMATLDRLRPTVAAAACGMASRALEEALAHARSREQFGRPLGDFQLIQQKLARSATELAAARLLTYRAAAKADRIRLQGGGGMRGGERITLEASMAKSYATEMAQRAVDDAVQVLGGRGVLMASPVDLLYRSVRALRIYEGATEVHHLIIARHLLDER